MNTTKSMTTTTINPIPEDLHLVIAITRDRATLSSFWRTKEDAEQHIQDISAKDINLENGYIWASITPVSVKSWEPNMPQCKIEWVPSKQIS
jgi:hypothetical protein